MQPVPQVSVQPQTRLIDFSVPVENGMVTWPGDPAVDITRRLDLACGDAATVSALSLGAHTGTHVDAFSHFKPDGAPLHAMDLSRYVGKALVIDIQNPLAVTADELAQHRSDLENADRVLFRTQNSHQPWHRLPFDEHFCHIAPDAARLLADCGIQLVGIDYLSVESYQAQALYGQKAPTHHILMDAGIYIVEGLYLSEVLPGWYELICLPLSIANADGAPARVLLRSLP